ncbi:MAG: type II toxin-antitoxin system RelE/ParE family toxin [Lachnospiraceae bacterium]|nr:type II toxin-antitoxin system RelE/ParE family toxin [Lachnospiraceae bacterium]
MKYKVERTDMADSLIRKIVLFIAENSGNEVALDKLNYLEESIMSLEDDPYIGAVPRYNVLKRQGYLVLILEKDLVFYKVDEKRKLVTVYAVVDQRQDYLSIIRGL